MKGRNVVVMGAVDLSYFEATRIVLEIAIAAFALFAIGRTIFKRMGTIIDNQGRHEGKIDGINDRLDAQNGRVGKLEQKSAEHEGMLKAILASRDNTLAP